MEMDFEGGLLATSSTSSSPSSSEATTSNDSTEQVNTMNVYTVNFSKTGTVIRDMDKKTDVAFIRNITIDDYLELPIVYQVEQPQDKTTIGTLESYLPSSKKITFKNGSTISTLIPRGNGTLVLKHKGPQYEVGEIDLESLAEDKEVYEKRGFTNGYKLHSSIDTGVIEYFQKGKSKRALIRSENGFKEFIPLLMYSKILEDIDGKDIKPKEKPKPKKASKVVVKPTEGKFVQWVKNTFEPNILDEQIEYLDQDGEKDRFYHYLSEIKRPVILNGPTGNGKTVLSKDYAYQNGQPYYFDTGSESFRISTAQGKFTPGIESPIFSPGSLTLAAIFGGVYVLEEMAPIDQDELTGLNIFLETGELPLNTHFGYEIVKAHPDFKMVATGNFNESYTMNELNDAYLQRWTQIKIGYPSEDATTDILLAQAPGLEPYQAQNISEVLFAMRKVANTNRKDLGMKGVVQVAKEIAAGTPIDEQRLFVDYVINPLTTYEGLGKNEANMTNELLGVLEEKW